jgi:hypothetical protein
MSSINLSFAGFNVNSAELPENSIEHLLQLGFSTAIKNSIAGVKAGVLGNGANPWSDDDIANECNRLAITGGGRDEETAAKICAAIQQDMFKSIVSGEARKSRASSPRMSDDDKLRRTIAIELLENVAKAKGKALPKRSKPDEKEAFEAFLSNALQNEKFFAAVAKEFSDRKRKAAKQSDDFADIF